MFKPSFSGNFFMDDDLKEYRSNHIVNCQKAQKPFYKSAPTHSVFHTTCELNSWSDLTIYLRRALPNNGQQRGNRMKRSYWLDLFTWITWQEFQKAGGSVSGFRESRWKNVQKIQEGDYLLCYLTGLSRFIGLLEVTSKPFQKFDKDIWKDEEFPCRVRVKPIIQLIPETAIPVSELRGSCSFFQDQSNPIAWIGYFRSSPFKWKDSDGEAVLKALYEAQENPIKRPFDPKKLKYRPKAIQAQMGPVTVPDSPNEEVETQPEPEKVKGPSEHTEIQWLLLKLGSDMGFNTWVARNDRGKDFQGKRFAELPKLIESLPLQFDEAINKTIELIDVLWLQGNAIVAAFEIESTTSIYSGLLRMSDLIAMQPNLNIPLYLIAPDDRRDRVMTEVNRPTFSKMRPKLSEICRFISFSGSRIR
jgi:hypothetical protein